MDRARFQLLWALLGLVVMSSLALLFFGLDPQLAFIRFLHYPTVIAQLVFTVAVLMREECREQLLSFTRAQALLLLALLVYVPTTSFFSPIPAAFFLSQFWMLHILFFVAVLAFFRTKPDANDDAIWLSLGVAALIHVIAFLFAWAIWPEQIRLEHHPAFENIRFLGYFAAPAATVMAIWFLTGTTRWMLAFLCYLAAAFYLIYTGSRGGAVAVVAGFGIAVAYVARKRLPFAFTNLIALVAATCLLVFLSMLLPKLPWVPLFDRAVEVAQAASSTQALTSRNLLWSDVSVAIKERWLLGYGPSYVSHIFSLALDPSSIQYPNESIRNPHNIVLQVLLHWGVLGALIIAAIALAFARDIWSVLMTQSQRALLPFTAIATMLVHSLVSGVFFYPYSTVIAIIAIARLISLCRDKAA